jgi:predicted nucleic acid-binding protein
VASNSSPIIWLSQIGHFDLLREVFGTVLITPRGIKNMEASVEAVIISGPRRGEIIRLPDEVIAEVSDDDIQVLNAALDELITAIDRVAIEVRATTDTLRERAGQP